MGEITTARMSSKGQIVIPEDIRNRLGLKAGTQFVVLSEKDTVVLRIISAPAMEEFDGLISEARRQARAARMKRSDIGAAVTRARASKQIKSR